MTILDVVIFISGVILIAIGSILLYSFLTKSYKQNTPNINGIFFLGPIPIIFNNDGNQYNNNLMYITFSILIGIVFFILYFLIFFKLS
ncbi:MAG: TIGR00304 family membrane protein [Nitrososphaeraceae archaeon]